MYVVALLNMYIHIYIVRSCMLLLQNALHDSYQCVARSRDWSPMFYCSQPYSTHKERPPQDVDVKRFLVIEEKAYLPHIVHKPWRITTCMQAGACFSDLFMY